MDLARKKCTPCSEGTAPFGNLAARHYLALLRLPWRLVGGKKIRQVWKFKNFPQAIVFVNKLAKLAEDEGHHPNIYIRYNEVTVELSTHSIGGLSENDFILARKIEMLA